MESERKQFKFYKSYFDVYNELSNKDKLLYIEALFNRQFYGIEPTLKGQANFAYISQKHNIDAQVKGYEDRLKTTLSDPTQGGTQGGAGQTTIDNIKEESIIYKLKNFNLSINETDYNKLLLQYSEDQIQNIFDAIDNAKSTKNKKSLYSTALNWLKRNNARTKEQINADIYKKECNTLTDKSNPDIKYYFKLLTSIKTMPDLMKKDAITFEQSKKIRTSEQRHRVNIFSNIEFIAGGEAVRYNKALNVGIMTWIKNNSKALN